MKTCEWCGQDYAKRKSEALWQYEERRFCSRPCARRHTIHPTSKPCVICGHIFTPHKTKRVRAQTCGPACKSALLSLRNAERKAS